MILSKRGVHTCYLCLRISLFSMIRPRNAGPFFVGTVSSILATIRSTHSYLRHVSLDKVLMSDYYKALSL